MNTEKTYDKAIEAYNKLLALYPDDSIGNNNLGVIYGDLEEWDKSLEKYKVAAQFEKDILTWGNLTSNYETRGLYDEARKIYEDYLENVSDDARFHAALCYNYIYQGKFDLALEEAEKAFLL